MVGGGDSLPPPIDDATYAAALDKLGTLITGRSRKDGHSWEWNHAMEVMQLCLEVSVARDKAKGERAATLGRPSRPFQPRARPPQNLTLT